MKRSSIVRKVPMLSRSRLARTPMAAVSKKRQKENRVRRRNVIEAFGTDPECFVRGCGRPADDAHELLSRARGGSITDVTGIRPVCRTHHTWITTRPAEAEALGYALKSPPRRNEAS